MCQCRLLRLVMTLFVGQSAFSRSVEWRNSVGRNDGLSILPDRSGWNNNRLYLGPIDPRNHRRRARWPAGELQNARENSNVAANGGLRQVALAVRDGIDNGRHHPKAHMRALRQLLPKHPDHSKRAGHSIPQGKRSKQDPLQREKAAGGSSLPRKRNANNRDSSRPLHPAVKASQGRPPRGQNHGKHPHFSLDEDGAMSFSVPSKASHIHNHGKHPHFSLDEDGGGPSSLPEDHLTNQYGHVKHPHFLPDGDGDTTLPKTGAAPGIPASFSTGPGSAVANGRRKLPKERGKQSALSRAQPRKGHSALRAQDQPDTILSGHVGSGNASPLAHSPDQGRPGSLTSYHGPDAPNFELLLQQMKPIIPGKFSSAGAGHNKTQTPKVNPDKDFLKNVLIMVHDTMVKEEGKRHDKRQLLELISAKAKACLELLQTLNHIPREQMMELIYLFNKFFEKKKKHPLDKEANGPRGRAPFCKLGEDCFEDVNHQKIALEIKRVALALSSYLRDRMAEERDGRGGDPNDPERKVKFKTDAVLTQTTTILAKLHRAILRNWHHILMIIGNLAGNHGAKPVHPDLPDLVEFKCSVLLEPAPPAKTKQKSKCPRGKKWHKSDECRSPITSPETECLPAEHKANFEKVHGHYAFTVEHPGRWGFVLKATILHPEGKQLNKADRIVGSVDKLLAKGNRLVEMASISQQVRFPHTSSKGSKIHLETEGSGLFAKGDRILLRLNRNKEKLEVEFQGHLLEEHKGSKEEKGGKKKGKKGENIEGNEGLGADNEGKVEGIENEGESEGEEGEGEWVVGDDDESEIEEEREKEEEEREKEEEEEKEKEEEEEEEEEKEKEEDEERKLLEEAAGEEEPETGVSSEGKEEKNRRGKGSKEDIGKESAKKRESKESSVETSGTREPEEGSTLEEEEEEEEEAEEGGSGTYEENETDTEEEESGEGEEEEEEEEEEELEEEEGEEGNSKEEGEGKKKNKEKEEEEEEEENEEKGGEDTIKASEKEKNKKNVKAKIKAKEDSEKKGKEKREGKGKGSKVDER